MRRVTTVLGGLRCQVVDASEPDGVDLLVVLLHGYGAPGDDLVPLATELLRAFPALEGRCRFLFPAAPEEAEGAPGGRAWWQLDMERLMLLQYAKAEGIARMQREVPKELDASRRKVLALLDEATRQASVPYSKVVLGGFSQGAMLSTDVALRMEEPPAALALFSGTLINAEDWRARAPRRTGLKVLQAHGTADPLLPFENATALRDLLSGAGLEVDFVSFPDGHTIPAEAFARFGALLTSRLADAAS